MACKNPTSINVILTVAAFYVVVVSSFFVITSIQENAKERTIREEIVRDYLGTMEDRVHYLRTQVLNLTSNAVAEALNPSQSCSLNGLKKQFQDITAKLIHDLARLAHSTLNVPSVARDFDLLKENIRLIRQRTYQLREFHEPWRISKGKDLARRVQKRFYFLQHPADCVTSKKLICNLNKNCGFGCQVHHALTCLIVAVSTNRTMILLSHPWSYSNDGWEAFFQPVTNCNHPANVSLLDTYPVLSNSEESDSSFIVTFPLFPNVAEVPEWLGSLPFAVPMDIAEEIASVHQQPGLWWIGQGLKYLWRLRQNVSELFSKEVQRMRLQTPFVGIHVRRTDKLMSESKFYNLKKYMSRVEEYFEQLFVTNQQLRNSTKRIFLATDNVNVLREFRTEYSDRYQMFSSDVTAKTGGSRLTRFSQESLLGIIKDITFLSQSSHIVCTFSSNVCRLAYALMQVAGDASGSFDSLDDSFWLQGSGTHLYKASYSHQGRNSQELEIQENDEIIGVSNLWNGLSEGRNRKTGKQGLFPSYKVAEVLQLAGYKMFD